MSDGDVLEAVYEARAVSEMCQVHVEAKMSLGYRPRHGFHCQSCSVLELVTHCSGQLDHRLQAV